MTGKHGLLGAGGSSADMEMYTDTTASILYEAEVGRKGSMWIVGRSLLIHENVDGAPRWSCANIGEAGMGVNVAFPGGGEVEGSMELFQPSAGYASFEYARSTGSAYSTAVTVKVTSALEAAPGNKARLLPGPRAALARRASAAVGSLSLCPLPRCRACVRHRLTHCGCLRLRRSGTCTTSPCHCRATAVGPAGTTTRCRACRSGAICPPSGAG